MSLPTSLLAPVRHPPRLPPRRLEWIDDPRFAFPFLLRRSGYGHAAALLVLLHDAGENESQFAAVAEGIAEGVAVAMPRGCVPLRRGAFAWDGASPRAAGPACRSSLRGLLDFLGALQADVGVDAARTAVAGFGEGGVLCASAALAASRPAAGLGLLGSAWPGIEGEARDARHVCAFVGHGVLDERFPLDGAEHAAVQLARGGARCHERRYLAKHELTPQMRGDFVDWFNAAWLDRLVLASPLAAAG
jgi:phospholipase/carboxylesterase